MRRFPSILLIVLLWLGPLAAAFQGVDESRLPACCRRNGAHHCAMDEQTATSLALRAQQGPAFGAPAHCPYCPRAVARTAGPVFAFRSETNWNAKLAKQRYQGASVPAEPEQATARIFEGRGPPPGNLA